MTSRFILCIRLVSCVHWVSFYKQETTLFSGIQQHIVKMFAFHSFPFPAISTPAFSTPANSAPPPRPLSALVSGIPSSVSWNGVQPVASPSVEFKQTVKLYSEVQVHPKLI